MAESPVFMFDEKDPEMQRAYELARANFKYFWRELSWERRRIIPGLDMAAVKAPFSDGKKKADSDTPEVEHMWVDEIEFDGASIKGVLLNDPNWLTSVHAGDEVRFPAKQMSDWMYVISGNVFGAYTVNLMRSRMDPRERAGHDQAWGLNFGDPKQIQVVPAKKGTGLLAGWFGGKSEPVSDEHPMSENMAPELAKQLAANPGLVNQVDDEGWTFLHREALAGNAAPVKVLLDHGANFTLRTKHGATALQLAHVLGWEKVVALLLAKGAKA